MSWNEIDWDIVDKTIGYKTFAYEKTYLFKEWHEFCIHPLAYKEIVPIILDRLKHL